MDGGDDDDDNDDGNDYGGLCHFVTMVVVVTLLPSL